jgi:hypothetical protein
MTGRQTGVWRRAAAVGCLAGVCALYPVAVLAQADPSGAAPRGPGVTTEVAGVQVERSAITLPNTGTGPIDRDEGWTPLAAVGGLLVLGGAGMYARRRWFRKQIGA